MSRTVLAEALEKAIETKGKKTRKAAAPVVETVPPVVTDVPAAERIESPPAVYHDARADELLDLRAAIKTAEKQAKPLEGLLRELAKTSEVHGDRAIARLVTGSFTQKDGTVVEQTWFQLVEKKA